VAHSVIPIADPHFALEIGISVCLLSEERAIQNPNNLPDEVYEGWEFIGITNPVVTDPPRYRYEDGALVGSGIRQDLSHTSISELIEWGLIEPVTGHVSPLPMHPCPECFTMAYCANDYLCHQCRRERDA
jgi:hypothetical protein